LSYCVTALAGYLLGSIPTGYLVGKAKGVDIRTVGSKNMGATNVLRVLGKRAGILVLVVDALKGFMAVALVVNFYPELNHWLPRLFPAEGMTDPRTRLNHGIVAGLFAVLGHNYTCWLGFKGGKGIATSAGVFFALAPLGAGLALVAWLIALAVSRYVSVASIVSAVVLPTVVWFTNDSLTLRLVTIALGVLAIVKHRANIQRLRNGTERRFGEKTPPTQEPTK
jgi:glycerol-3-phosphate acyltransferase PlsY